VFVPPARSRLTSKDKMTKSQQNVLQTLKGCSVFAVELIWEVCGLPENNFDFGQTLGDSVRSDSFHYKILTLLTL
jgi:hypothetical protein